MYDFQAEIARIPGLYASLIELVIWTSIYIQATVNETKKNSNSKSQKVYKAITQFMLNCLINLWPQIVTIWSNQFFSILNSYCRCQPIINVKKCGVGKLLWVTGQLINRPTLSQSSHGRVNSQTSQLDETFDVKLAVNNCYKFAVNNAT